MPIIGPQGVQQNYGRSAGAAPSFGVPPQVHPQPTPINAGPSQAVMPFWQTNQIPSRRGSPAHGADLTVTRQPLWQEQPTYYLPKWPETVGALVPPTVMPWLYETLSNKQNFIPVYGEPPPTIVVKRPTSYGINGPPDAYRSIRRELVPLYRLTDLNANSATHVAVGSSAFDQASAEGPSRKVEVLPPPPSDVQAMFAPGEQAPMTKASQYRSPSQGQNRPPPDFSVVDRQLEGVKRHLQAQAQELGNISDPSARQLKIDEMARRCRENEEVTRSERPLHRGRPTAAVSIPPFERDAQAPVVRGPVERHPYNNLFTAQR
ncbi:hypothetical protein EJ03DRAFT_64964 [Teratosphaeria nubilosa]|uniref:Uncharacterized protein n=1 Tax=Teratosphaeria nubilosa TaxID=161662 RepID=A0A6G1LCD3_9PEZI|nr:hypothetical protein EJ03DRAFT_64964 [Teratosphaeria nubilosa]